MSGQSLHYSDLDDEELAKELRERSRQVKELLQEISKLLREAANVE